MRRTLLGAFLVLAACGQPGSTAQVSVTPSATRAPVSVVASEVRSPGLTSTPTPTQSVATMTCSRGAGSAMAVLGGRYVYEVSDPVHPRLVCRGANTLIQLLDGNAISYITIASSRVVVIRRDLTTGAEAQIARLPADPRGAFASWTSDGLLEVYESGLQMHLWSGGADHVLYGFAGFFGGFESRWNAPLGVAEFSPDHAYLAVSYPVDFSAQNFRIFSVSDQHQVAVVGTGYPEGGTWIGNDRFVWGTGSVMEWTPTGGARSIRAEKWFGTTSSSDRQWLAATSVTDNHVPHVVIVPVAGGLATHEAGIGSGPEFVTQSTLWYFEEGQCPPSQTCGADPTGPDGTVRALDVTNRTDRVVTFRVGENPA